MQITNYYKACVIVYLLFISMGVYAQKTENLQFPLKDTLIKNSLYNKIRLIDARIDTNSLGMVQKGLLNNSVKLMSPKPLQSVLSDYLSSITDKSASNGQLLFRLTKFESYEVTKSFSETGFCILQGVLYQQHDDIALKIAAVDTVVSIRSGMDVTKALLKMTAKTLTNFIKINLLKKPVDNTGPTTYSLINFDLLEKKKLPVYSLDKLVDGIYFTYKSFAAQLPDRAIKLEGNAIYPGAVKQIEADGKVIKVKEKNIYAIVFLGTAYMPGNIEYYEVKREKNDLYFTGQFKVPVSAEERLIATSMFGIIGLMAVSNSEAKYDMKIDYRNGQYIRLREVVEPISQANSDY